MILETNGPLIAEKVTSHNIDADSPLSEQVEQHFFLVYFMSVMCVNITERHKFPKLNSLQQKYGFALLMSVTPKLHIEGVFDLPTTQY